MPGIIENFKSKKADYGKKGNNLKILMELFKDDDTISIPETIILPKSLYNKVISENGDTDFSKYNNIHINPQLEKEILDSVHQKFGNKKLVIRSSATCEDSIFFSGAGQYESFLNIDEDEKIITAIKKIYASLFSNNSKLYSKIYGINLKKESMAILIQEVAPVVKSGVMFSCNPIDLQKKYIIESANGLGTNVVEGTGRIKHLEINYEEKENIDDKEICKLISIIDKIKEKFKYDVDIEWGIDAVGKVYIFQTRPIIYKNPVFNVKYNKSIVDCSGISVSKGFSIGKIEKITNNKTGGILYQNEKYDFNDLQLLLSCKGVILKEDIRLSHFANILRELVKPCVYIKNFHYNEDNLYVIDGFNGNIIDFDNLNIQDKINLMFENFNYMGTILNDSFERYNGILNIVEDNKFEEVVFDIDEKNIISLLGQLGFKRKYVKQNIYTYDFKDNSLIKNNTIFRIQTTNKKINVQFKTLNTAHSTYRTEKGIIISFDSLKHAKDFMQQYSMVETGYQERKIVKYELDDVCVNIIKWPGCAPYLGIECKSLNGLKEINKKLNLDNCLITGWGGKQIFEKLNLTIDDCKF